MRFQTGAAQLEDQILGAVARAGASRTFVARTRRLQPKVTSSQLAGKYPAIIVVDMLERLRPHSQLYRLYYEIGIEADTVHEHQRILDGIIDHNEGAAGDAMRSHLEAARTRLASAVRDAEPPA